MKNVNKTECIRADAYNDDNDGDDNTGKISFHFYPGFGSGSATMIEGSSAMCIILYCWKTEWIDYLPALHSFSPNNANRKASYEIGLSYIYYIFIISFIRKSKVM